MTPTSPPEHPRPTLPLRKPLLALVLVLVLLCPTPAWAAMEEAVLAGGCFWCLEHDLEGLSGVQSVESGYSGGRLERPTYRQVSAGGTGHQESVRVRFNPKVISYATLLRAYWRHVDPLDGGGQFCDRGDSYRPVIFTAGPEQARQARASQTAAARELGRPMADLRVAVVPLQRFWPAEGYHQNYAERNDLKYRYYRWSCGRDRRLDAVWGRRARRSDPWSQR
ncbi:MAG: peptide-methionine (S)-S-oxide reductase MsrA [Cyanobacteriota bacterium]|nr:peptide-methionine (S)-S-oxide reductase MsrA [Cyanobacteriota bacterium]